MSTTGLTTFKKIICEQLIVKCLENFQLSHHHDILNKIFDFHADDCLSELRVCLKCCYQITFQKTPHAAVGIIYKQLECSASDLRENKAGVFYTNTQKLKSAKDTPQGVWELI